MNNYFKRLIVLDLANNHMGSVTIAKKIIDKVKEAYKPFKNEFQIAIKLQYRNLDTFIHPDFKGNHDYKFVKRFEETKLLWNGFKEIKDYIKQCGFITACTPFDEIALQKVIEHDFDIIKIASCSFTDWPLLEEIVKHDKPIIASCGAAELEDIDKVVAFMQHRNKDFALLHCVPEYPTSSDRLELSKISFFKNKYTIPVGASFHCHKDSFDLEYSIISALSQDAKVIEFHVKLEDHIGNEYSLPVEDLDVTFSIISRCYKFLYCDFSISETQKKNIRNLQRGVYVKEGLTFGEKLTKDNTFLAMPCLKEQLSANDFSKYKEYNFIKDHKIEANKPLFINDLHIEDKRQQVLDIIQKLIPIIKESGVVIPDGCKIELSHHCGLDNFKDIGATIFNIINNKEYCKKIIVVLSGQFHPEHYHIKKHETFHVLHGDLICYLKGEQIITKPTDDNLIIIDRKATHSFTSDNGCVFEEISTTHFNDDSIYTYEVEKNRKTTIIWLSKWLNEAVK